jgi:probable rRNA maturation factor
LKLSVFKEIPVRVPAAHLSQLFEMVSSTEAPSETGEINLVFTTDAAMRRLNRQYRGLDKTTDVLSFNLDESSDDGGNFGEIYISVARAGHQAEEYGHGRYEEYLRLACHGFLHLFGYDHEEPVQEKAMQKREKYFLTRLSKAAKRC